jgi:hypothetical protein
MLVRHVDAPVVILSDTAVRAEAAALQGTVTVLLLGELRIDMQNCLKQSIFSRILTYSHM